MGLATCKKFGMQVWEGVEFSAHYGGWWCGVLVGTTAILFLSLQLLCEVWRVACEATVESMTISWQNAASKASLNLATSVKGGLWESMASGTAQWLGDMAMALASRQLALTGF